MASAESQVIRASLQRDDPKRTTTLAEERAGWLAAVAGQVDPPGVVTAPVRLGGINALEIRPADAGSDAIIHVHGGGLVSGAPETHRALATKIARQSSSRVLLPRYRLLPEHTAAEAMADVVEAIAAVCQWGDVGRIHVGGDSSGAALGLGALLALGGASSRLAGFYAISGAFDALLRSPSMADNEGVDPLLSRAELERWQSLVSPVARLDEVPLNLLDCDLQAAPPTLLIAGSDELWRDDSVRLCQRMRAVGRPCELKIYDGMWHVWPMFGAFPEADEAVADIVTFCAGQGNWACTS